MNPVTDENPPALKVPRRGSLRADATGTDQGRLGRM